MRTRSTMGRWRRVAAVMMAVLCLAGTAQAQSAPQSLPALRTALARPHAVGDAVARQHLKLQTTGRRSGRANSTATKVTAVAAMGFVGFFTGMYVAFVSSYALRVNGDGRMQMWTGGIAGAVGGGALGAYLASR